MSGPSQQHPAYPAGSPTLSHFDTSFSPPNGAYARPSYGSHGNHPPTPAPLPLPPTAQSPHLRAPPLSPPSNGLSSGTVNGSGRRQRDPHRAPSTYYDPTSDQGDQASSSWARSRSTQSPVQTQQVGLAERTVADPPSALSSFHCPLTAASQSRTSLAYSEGPTEQTSFAGSHGSPVKGQQLPYHSPPLPTSHSHPPSRTGSVSRSPFKHAWEADATLPPRNGTSSQTREAPPSARPQKAGRTADPMAFSSILSNASAEPAAPPAASYAPPPPKRSRASPAASAGQASPVEEAEPVVDGRAASRRTSSHARSMLHRNEGRARPRSHADADAPRKAQRAPRRSAGSVAPDPSPYREAQEPKPRQRRTDEPEPVALDEAEAGALLELARAGYRERSRKRTIEIDEAETRKRKRRRTALAEKLAAQLSRHAEAGEARFRKRHADEAVAEVQHKEVLDEKERKKDMQRKRRREKTVQNEYQKRNEAMEKAQKAADEAERDKFVKEAARAEKKARATKMILQRGDGGAKELREVTPLAPNLEGGTMSSFSALAEAVEAAVEPAKKRGGRGGARPRKSKEQKQAEKDAAEAAHAAAMEQDEPVAIAPKDEVEEPAPPLRREPKEAKARAKDRAKDREKDATPAPFVPYVSKGYNQIYDQIWRDLARKDIPRVYRVKESSLSTRQSNLRKTAQLASKEARRWQLRTNKSTKDVQARAKRTMREMMSFWKRNEREERDMRRMAERQELENAKRAEADREANRQKRKLNFLISQTELYSHFVGAKVKTDEVERSTDRADVAAPPDAAAAAAAARPPPVPAHDDPS
ncbi:MAG: putative DNA helicase ino80, partial [Thelocarpon impressellum]